MFKKINTNQAPSAIGPYEQGVVFDQLIFTSGQIPINPESGEVVEGDIALQTEQVMKNLQAVLEAGGGTLNTVIKTTCFLQSMDDFGAFNEVYGKYFDSHKPARSCVAVRTLPKGVLCEVEAIGIKA